MAVFFSGNPSTTAFVNYLKLEGSERTEEHYEMPTNVMNSIPKHHVITKYGDFNALIEKKEH